MYPRKSGTEKMDEKFRGFKTCSHPLKMKKIHANNLFFPRDTTVVNKLNELDVLGNKHGLNHVWNLKCSSFVNNFLN